MKAVNRRSTLALGLTAAATPLIAWTTSGAAQAAGSDEGKELAPGVRQITHGERLRSSQLMRWSSCAISFSNPERRRRII